MHIKKSSPKVSYTKISNDLFSDARLTDGAMRLYGFIASLPNGKSISDRYIMKCLNVSQRSLTNRKKELKDTGLLLMVPIAPRVHDLYLGYPGFPADRVRQMWNEEDGED
jgi:hypothetical protein